LRPGTHLLRRADGTVQVGLDPARAVRLPGSPTVLATLDRLRLGAEPLADDTATLALLERHALLATGSEPPCAVLLPVLRGFGHPTRALLVDELSRHLRVQRPGRSKTRSVGVLAGVGEPDRALVDDWTRAGVPHLVLRLTEGHAVLGPFVEPARTACLRCVDAHLTDADSSWPLLVHQYAVASSRDRPDGSGEPVDQLLATLAAAWAARDLASYAAGRRPATWSATVRIEAELTAIESRGWLRHPECGCSR